MVSGPVIISSDGSKREGRISTSTDAPAGLAPRELRYIRVDHQIRLHLDGDVQIVIESPFDLIAGGMTHHLDPLERTGLGPMLDVYPSIVSSLTIDQDATLLVEFDSGARVVVPPDEAGEAWQIVGPGDALVVCNPGTDGLLSIWQ